MAQPPDECEPDPDIDGALKRLLLLLGGYSFSLRERQHWSQQATAKAAGLHQETIQRLERGDCDPRLSTLVRLFYIHGYELQIGLKPTTQRP